LKTSEYRQRDREDKGIERKGKIERQENHGRNFGEEVQCRKTRDKRTS
jgi:hypothetical protein